MSFFSNEVKTTLTFTPLLRTREMVEVTAYFVVLGPISWRVQFSSPLAPCHAAITAELSEVAAATVHRWALGFASAEDCLTKEAYASLEGELRHLDSPEFRVDRIRVRSIVPLTPRVEPIVKDRPVDRTLRELIDDEEHSVIVEAFGARFDERHPELKGTKQGERLEKRYYSKALQIFADRNEK